MGGARRGYRRQEKRREVVARGIGACTGRWAANVKETANVKENELALVM